MKRITGLYDKIISVDNLRLADAKARRGKAHTQGVHIHDRNREENIQALHEALLTKTFRTSKYDVFTIYEPKERLIFRLPYYPDRIVHHAIMNVLEPIWVSTFTHNTYSCIKKRGIEGCAKAVDKAIRFYRDAPVLYCLKIDLKKYYPSIDHEVLKTIVRRHIKDKDLLWLLDEIIDSADGLPIGNYLSQYLANLMLAYFMHWVNERMPDEVRVILSLAEKPVIKSFEYADDIVFLATSKEILHVVFDLINKYLTGLKLTIKGNWQIFPIAHNRFDKHGRALDFVGYKFYRKQKLMRKSIKQNFCRAVAKLNKKLPPPALKAYKQAVAPWLGWAQHSKSKHLLKTIINPIYYASIL